MIGQIIGTCLALIFVSLCSLIVYCEYKNSYQDKRDDMRYRARLFAAENDLPWIMSDGTWRYETTDEASSTWVNSYHPD